MTAARRRIVRPIAITPLPDPASQRRLQRLRARLQAERAAEARWWKRLRRALNAL